jgi:DNA excision repair protein ERCC-4
MRQPDVTAAAAVGLPSAPGAAEAFNLTPQDVLRQLPGVFPHNYRKLMNSVLNLRELSERTTEQLAGVIGAANAKLLHGFLHREA